MSLSAEAQHLIDSLEAHFSAVRKAVADGETALIEHVERAWDDAVEALDAFRTKLDGAIPGVGDVTTAETGATTSAAAPTNGADAEAAPDQGSGEQVPEAGTDPSARPGSAGTGADAEAKG